MLYYKEKIKEYRFLQKKKLNVNMKEATDENKVTSTHNMGTIDDPIIKVKNFSSLELHSDRKFQKI